MTLRSRAARTSAAMRERGLTLRERRARPSPCTRAATDDPAEARAAGLRHRHPEGALGAGARRRDAPLLGPDTAVVTPSTACPGGTSTGWAGLRGRRLESVDPGGAQWQASPPERAIGCVVYPAAEVVEPGVIQHIEGDRFSLGEPTDGSTPTGRALAEALIAAGLQGAGPAAHPRRDLGQALGQPRPSTRSAR